MRFFAQLHVHRTIRSAAPGGQSPQNWKRKTQANNPNTIFRDGVLQEALEQTCFPLDLNAYASLLQNCSNIESLKKVHAHMFPTGLNQNIFIATKLVSLYGTCGNMEYARLVFDKMNERNIFLWNAIIRGYARNGPCDEAITLYYQMQRAGVKPDNFTFPFVLKACAEISALQEGKEIHDDIIRTGFELDVFVGNSLVTMYAKCGSIDLARQLFDKMSNRDVVSWNAMIVGFAQNGHSSDALSLFNQMLQANLKPDSITLVSVLQACAHLGALQQGKWIHDYINRSGFPSNISVENSLVAMYSKCGRVTVARLLFDKMSKRDVVSWNAMIAGYTQNGHANEALNLFHQMQLADITPNSVTMVSMLSACALLTALEQGKCIHGYIIRSGFMSDVVLDTAVIDMYAKCGSIVLARHLFDKMFPRNVVSWNAMIAGYAQCGHSNEALTLFNQMQITDLKPNSITMASVLPLCANLTALHQRKGIHSYIIRSGLESDVVVGTALVDMYVKCGNIDIACKVFDNMSTRNVVSWNAMIAGYTQTGHANDALSLFNKMQQANTEPDMVTMVSVLSACAQLAALQQGMSIHAYIIKIGAESDVFLGNSLIDMYAKCGSIDVARKMFDKMFERDVVSWNAMIAAYGMHGHGEDALVLFSQMQQTGVNPDHVTFVCVLSACSHAGLVDEGWQYFECMSQDYHITPREQHYACMVDLLGRAGCMDEAQDFIEKMPLEPGASVWGALLGACRIHCNIQLGERVADRLFDLKPENAGYYVLLSNIYAEAGRWYDVAKVRTMMKDKGVKKTPGCSFIEVNNRVHAFVVGDRSHPQSEKIYAMLNTLAGQMKEAGYASNTNFVLHDDEEEVKEHMISTHSEKLAILCM
eukprot:Gb_00199 [translate_table: standard]